jgi:hypothetical protein
MGSRHPSLPGVPDVHGDPTVHANARVRMNDIEPFRRVFGMYSCTTSSCPSFVHTSFADPRCGFSGCVRWAYYQPPRISRQLSIAAAATTNLGLNGQHANKPLPVRHSGPALHH